MKKYLSIAIFTILLLLSLFTISVYASGRRGHYKHWVKACQKVHFMKELNLTTEQQKQLDELKFNHRKAIIDIQAKIKIARMELGKLLEDPKADSKKIDAKISELTQLHSTMLKNHVDFRMKLNKILTPEQLEKMKSLRPMKGYYGMVEGKGMGPCGRFDPHEKVKK
ncbi:MAG: Spy/CpxP family protein refolding chaperone [Candidatus Aminicenantia bacterium]